jgi:hypothetical protein
VHAEVLVARVREALESTTDNHRRVEASVQAYFDFVDGAARPARARSGWCSRATCATTPPVRERVERMTGRCVEALADTIAHDTGYREEEAVLLSVALSGLAEVSARWWLDSQERVPKERAVELLVGLVWRGISGSPRTT